MAKFTDSAGREWRLASNTAALKRVREATGAQLGKVSDSLGDEYTTVLCDLEKLTAVLFAWCEGQHPGVTLAQFEAEVMDGETIHAARDAVNETFLLFFPSRQREAMQARAAELEAIAAEVQEMQFQTQKAKLRGGAATSSTSATDSPA